MKFVKNVTNFRLFSKLLFLNFVEKSKNRTDAVRDFVHFLQKR